MRGLFATATAVFQVAFYKKVQCSEIDPYDGKTTVLDDPIYGKIELPPICVKIIKTPEFQRLQKIKLLGATYEVFPDDVHTIYRHCLGVCHLAGIFGRYLQRQINEELKNETSDLIEEVKITNDDIICLQIAGLCHDIGHGPMSQAFESHFIRKLDPASKWTHEQGSLMMFDYLVGKNNIPIKATDRVFIKQLIHRDQKMKNETGRTKEKDFLYEIISNEENGIDVDTWDYFARDSYMYMYYKGFKYNYLDSNFISYSRVRKVYGDWHICYKDLSVKDIYTMFTPRLDLHRGACKQKTGQILERMYMKALINANEPYRITTSDGKKWKISECINNAEAFSQLTDHVFDDIRNSSDEELKDAKDIMKIIDARKHYKLVSTASPRANDIFGIKDNLKATRATKKVIEDSIGKLQQEESQILEEIVRISNGKLSQDDLVVDISIFEHERQERNPVDKVYFHSESEISLPKESKLHGVMPIYLGTPSVMPDSVKELFWPFSRNEGDPIVQLKLHEEMLQRNKVNRKYFDGKTVQFQEYRILQLPRKDQLVYRNHLIRLYIKKDDEELQEEARKCFKIWCKKRYIIRVN